MLHWKSKSGIFLDTHSAIHAGRSQTFSSGNNFEPEPDCVSKFGLEWRGRYVMRRMHGRCPDRYVEGSCESLSAAVITGQDLCHVTS